MEPLSKTVSPSKRMSDGRLGRDPVAMTMTSSLQPEALPPVPAGHRYRVGIQEARVPLDHLDGVPVQGPIDQLQLPLHHDPLRDA